MKLVLMALILAPTMAFAGTTIKITSFTKTSDLGSKDTTAEVCGLITQDPVVDNSVIVVADPGKLEGHYVVGFTSTGNFCHVIRTISGNVAVQTMDHPARATVKSKIHSLSSSKK